MTTYQRDRSSARGRRIGYRVTFPDGTTKRVNTIAQGRRAVESRGETTGTCKIARIRVSHNGQQYHETCDWR